MSMPLDYKDLRDELNIILAELCVPREYYYQLTKLEFFLNCIKSIKNPNPKIDRVLEIINEIFPKKEEQNVQNSTQLF